MAFSFLVSTNTSIQCFNTSLLNQLEKTFSHIAKTSYSIKVSDPQYSDQLVKDYWKHCLIELDGMSPPLAKLLNEQIPTIHGNKVIVKVQK